MQTTTTKYKSAVTFMGNQNLEAEILVKEV